VRGAEFNPSCWTADERAAAACIFDPACGATDLVAAIKAAPAFLRDTIIGSIDVAQYGDVGNEDGNWSSQDVEAAANAENLIAMGVPPETAAMVASVAGRLSCDCGWEDLDYEKPWIARAAAWVWDHKWQIAGLVVSGVCIGTSGGTAAPACYVAGGTLFAAKTTATGVSGGSFEDHLWNAGTTVAFMAPGLIGAGATSTAALGGGAATMGAAVGSTSGAMLVTAVWETPAILCSLFEKRAAPGMP
jgi:hypothetical protein